MDKPTERARELLAQQRQQRDRREEALHERSEAELHQATLATTEAQARTSMVEQRQAAEHTEATLLERSEEALKSSS